MFKCVSDGSSSSGEKHQTDQLGNGALPTPSDPVDPWEDDDSWYYEDYEDPDDLDEEFIAREKVALLMAEQDKTNLSSLGHQFDDLVISCTFRGIPCRYETLR